MSRVTRLRDGADPELRALLRDYEEQERPSAARVEALASRVVAGLAVTGAASTVASGAAATAGAGSGAASTAGVGSGVASTAGAGAGAGAAWGAASWLSLAPSSIWTVAVAVAVMGAGASFLVSQRDAGQAAAIRRAPRAAAPSNARAPRSETSRSPSAAPIAQPQGADAGATPEVLREPAPPLVQRRAGPEQVRPAPAPPTSEVTLLQRARQTLAREPGAALALLELHQREYPDGAFAEEREALAIEALRRIGLGEQAAQRLLLFNSRYPRSAYRDRLHALPPAQRPK